MDYNSDYSSAAAGIGAGAITICLIFLILSYVGLWKIFEKAGKPGWAAIVPIYNTIVLIEIVGKPTIWILWLIIPCTSPIFGIWLVNLLSKSFGKSVGYTIGILIFPFIFLPLLGLGDAKYLGPSAKEAQNGFNNPNNPFGNNNPFNDPFNKPPTTPGV